MIETEETLVRLSHVRLGVNLKRVKDLDINKVNELFLLTQEAHLQKILGKKLEGTARQAGAGGVYSASVRRELRSRDRGIAIPRLLAAMMGVNSFRNSWARTCQE